MVGSLAAGAGGQFGPGLVPASAFYWSSLCNQCRSPRNGISMAFWGFHWVWVICMIMCPQPLYIRWFVKEKAGISR
jgi:hypothetical protein